MSWSTGGASHLLRKGLVLISHRTTFAHWLIFRGRSLEEKAREERREAREERGNKGKRGGIKGREGE